jgi:hypothetical protein
MTIVSQKRVTDDLRPLVSSVVIEVVSKVRSILSQLVMIHTMTETEVVIPKDLISSHWTDVKR